MTANGRGRGAGVVVVDARVVDVVVAEPADDVTDGADAGAVDVTP